MSELKLNDVQLNDIRIKQLRLKTLINIDNITAESGSAAAVKEDVFNYCEDEKRNLLFDIMNILQIKEFDDIFSDTDGSLVKITIEESLRCISNRHSYRNSDKNSTIERSLFSEFVSVIANYDIVELVNLDIIHQYLKMIDEVIRCYDEISLESVKTI